MEEKYSGIFCWQKIEKFIYEFLSSGQEEDIEWSYQEKGGGYQET